MPTWIQDSKFFLCVTFLTIYTHKNFFVDGISPSGARGAGLALGWWEIVS